LRVIAIDKDPLGRQGAQLSSKNGLRVMTTGGKISAGVPSHGTVLFRVHA
jgi:hypothetical protein